MVITRKEKAGFGKDKEKTLELIAKLPKDIKDAALEYLKGYSSNSPVMNELIDSAVEAVASGATPINTIDLPKGVTPVSSKESTDKKIGTNLASKFGKSSFGEAINTLATTSTIAQLEDGVDGSSKYVNAKEEPVSAAAAVVGNHISNLLRIAGF
jgi:hypothetical protein